RRFASVRLSRSALARRPDRAHSGSARRTPVARRAPSREGRALDRPELDETRERAPTALRRPRDDRRARRRARGEGPGAPFLREGGRSRALRVDRRRSATLTEGPPAGSGSGSSAEARVFCYPRRSALFHADSETSMLKRLGAFALFTFLGCGGGNTHQSAP